MIERRKVIAAKGLKCFWCGICTDDSIYNTGSQRATTIDHVYNKLDPNREANNNEVVVACYACNQMRARMHEFVFATDRIDYVRAEMYIHDVEKPIEVEIEIEVPIKPMSRWQRVWNWIMSLFKKGSSHAK